MFQQSAPKLLFYLCESFFSPPWSGILPSAMISCIILSHPMSAAVQRVSLGFLVYAQCPLRLLVSMTSSLPPVLPSLLSPALSTTCTDQWLILHFTDMPTFGSLILIHRSTLYPLCLPLTIAFNPTEFQFSASNAVHYTPTTMPFILFTSPALYPRQTAKCSNQGVLPGPRKLGHMLLVYC